MNAPRPARSLTASTGAPVPATFLTLVRAPEKLRNDFWRNDGHREDEAGGNLHLSGHRELVPGGDVRHAATSQLART